MISVRNKIPLYCTLIFIDTIVFFYTDTMVLQFTDTMILHYTYAMVLHITSTKKQLDTYTWIVLTTIPDTILLHYMLLHNTDIMEEQLHDIALY